MQLTGMIDEDFSNYKLPAMFLSTSVCSFKCDRECGRKVCQNSELATAKVIEVNNTEIIERYMSNPITKAVVIGGLEPFDTFDAIFTFMCQLRKKTNDPIILYTGYNQSEIITQLATIQLYCTNVIIKFGRYVPDQAPHYDDVLGVNLASDNQYARRIC